MKVAKNMDSVFDNCTKDELEFDVFFDDDDTIIDIIEGMQMESYEDVLDEAPEDAGVKTTDVSIPEDEKYNADHGTVNDAEGSKDVDPKLDGEVGDKKEVTGNENSAESKAHDVTKDIDDAIGANDKQQTALEALDTTNTEVDPLTDDDEAERAGEVPPETVETEGVIQDKIKEKKAEKEEAKKEKEDKVNESFDGLTDQVIASIKAMNESNNDEPEADEEVATGEDPAETETECKKESTSLDDIISNALAEKVAAREAAETKMLQDIVAEMTEEELASDNVKELIEAKVAEKKAEEESKKICKGCGKSLDKCTCEKDAKTKKMVKEMVFQMMDEAYGITKEASDPIQDECDAAMRDGKASRPTNNVEGEKQEIINKGIGGSSNTDPIADKDDDEMRAGKESRPTDNVEGEKQKVVAAALEASDNVDDILADDDELIDASGLDDDIVSDKVQDSTDSNKIEKDVETQKGTTLENNQLEDIPDALTLEKTEDEAPANLTSDDEDEEILDIVEDEDEEEVDLEYDYEDDELIDIAIDGE